jgi:hypothetical protein
MAATIVDDPGFAMNQHLRAVCAAFAAPWLLLAGLLLLAMPAAAQAPDPFVVTGVAVDVTGASPLDARTRALAEGQRTAFRHLLQRMVPESSWPALPPASDSNVQAAVRGFQIASERASATRYIAKLDVSFHREAVRRLLRDAALPFTETSSRPMLLRAGLARCGRHAAVGTDQPLAQGLGDAGRAADSRADPGAKG